MEKKYPLAMKSGAANPDLDWCLARETILMLGVAIGQIEVVMRDGDESVGVLTNSFASMVNAVAAISMALQSLPDEEATRGVRETIGSNCELVTSQMQDAIVAFQFYDRMVQRLDHVCHTVDALADLIADPRRLHNPDEWVAIQEKIRSKYSIESERVMFDAILNGATVVEALELSQQATAKDRAADIELF